LRRKGLCADRRRAASITTHITTATRLPPQFKIKKDVKNIKTLVQQIWQNITELSVLLDGNPHVPVQDCKAILTEIEAQVKRLRLRELRKRM
jgi:predicted aconitase